MHHEMELKGWVAGTAVLFLVMGLLVLFANITTQETWHTASTREGMFFGMRPMLYVTSVSCYVVAAIGLIAFVVHTYHGIKYYRSQR